MLSQVAANTNPEAVTHFVEVCFSWCSQVEILLTENSEDARREAEARERAEAWAQLEAVHGTLLTRSEWAQHEHDYSEYVDMVWQD